jgi:cation diffusion facilitator family transporter
MAVNRNEKQNVAAASVAAAVGLTVIKVVVGFSTGSLGILAEAAHSSLDLAAAVMTLWAVRASGRAADKDHHYGHGKVENLSALFETTLLLATCVWIVSSAVQRLRGGNVEIEVSLWSFAVMLTSILVDVSRSRMLYRAAKKFNSQALEADALHFSTDIWSSAVVVLGLVCVKIGELNPSLHFLDYADPVAAISVALIVVWISVKLGRRTIDGLLDAAPPGMKQEIARTVGALPGVENCHHVRLRVSGAEVFVDLHVLMDGSLTLREAHDLTEEIERAIQKMHPNADVTVHPEPREDA